MPRPKQYKYEAVLDKAMQMFWAKGYNGTSVQELVDFLKLSKASMYEAFTDKHGLFMATLENFRKRTQDNIKLITALPAREGIAASFDSAVADLTDSRYRRGGFLTNTAAELAPHDKEVEKLVLACFDDLENMYITLINKGKDNGDISKDKDTKALAFYFTSSLQGLMVYSKAKQDKEMLDTIVKEIMRALD
jgi:TetR/AcrR family transcriptional repressor of nem operon